MTHDVGAETAHSRLDALITWKLIVGGGALKKEKSVAHVVSDETAHSRLDALMMRKLILGGMPQSQKSNKKGNSP